MSYLTYIVTLSSLFCATLGAVGQLVQLAQQLDTLASSLPRQPWVPPGSFVATLKYGSGEELLEHIELVGFPSESRVVFLYDYARTELFKVMFPVQSVHYSIRSYANVPKPVNIARFVGFVAQEMFAKPYSSEVPNYINELLIALFFEESQVPGAWNNNFDEHIQNSTVKENWRTFMRWLRDMATERGWPYKGVS